MVGRRSDRLVHYCWLGAQVDAPDFAALTHDVSRAGLDATVHFVGSQPNPADYYALFDVFVSTSREDPFPLVNLEAAAQGVPVVCFDASGGGREFVEEDAGFVVPYLDMDALADRVTELVESDDRRARLGLAARDKVRRMCDVGVVCPRVLDLVEGVSERWFALAPDARRAKREARRRLHLAQKGNTPHDLGISDLLNSLYEPSAPSELVDSGILELSRRLDTVDFFKGVYHLAYWLALQGERSRAASLYRVVAEFAAVANRELSGKACFKLGELAQGREAAVRHFRRCLELYPEHREAR